MPSINGVEAYLREQECLGRRLRQPRKLAHCDSDAAMPSRKADGRRRSRCKSRLVAGTGGRGNVAVTEVPVLSLRKLRVRLTSHGGHAPWHPHLDRDDDGPWGEWFLASSCMALTVLIWDRQRPPGGVCASPSCRNVYLTQGSGPVRRYCSRRCATRERVAAYRRAQA
jgi:hypothetical protein